MRVLAIAPEFTSLEGGAGIYISELARGFPRNSELHIVTSKREEPDDTRAGDSYPDNLSIHRLSGASISLRQDLQFKIDVASNLRTLLADSGADVVLSSSRMPDALCSPKRVPVPIVSTVHSTIENHLSILRASSGFSARFSKRERILAALGGLMVVAENQYYRSRRHFICVSDWGKRNLISSKAVDESRISVVPNGVDVNRFTPSLKEETNRVFPDIAAIDSMKILFAGRFTLAKGFYDLLKVVKLAESHAGMHFVIAGSGDHTVPGGILDRCTMVGQVPHTRMQHLYAACDILIVPSLYENMPLSILEAMASGCVPVASNVGGIAEVINHGRNGFLLPPGMPQEMAATLAMISEHPDMMKTIARAARESVVNGFGIDKTIRDTMSVLETVCSETTTTREG